jgi:hypothetical protein
MSATNSFKQMQEEDLQKFPPPPDVEDNILGSLQVLTIMGQAMELFIPKALEMFVLTLGGTVKEIDQAAKETLPGTPEPDAENFAPGSAASDDKDEPPVLGI